MEDPDFGKEVLDESDDENLGLPLGKIIDSQDQYNIYQGEVRQAPPSDIAANANQHTQGLAQQMIANATAEAMTVAVKNVFSDSVQKLKEWSSLPGKLEDQPGKSERYSRQSTPSDDGFVVLDAPDLNE